MTIDIRTNHTISALVGFAASTAAFVTIMATAGAPSTLLVVYQQQWHFPDWELTVAFSVYALTLLMSLLVLGSLSDHIGRKPLLIGSLVVQIAAMMVFLAAGDIRLLILARAVQGFATGAAMSAFSAYLTEVAPERSKKLASLMVSIASVGGMGLGAVATGFAIELTDSPAEVVFSCATVVFVIVLVAILCSPETIRPVPGAIASLKPRIVVPHAARRVFRSLTTGLIGIWMAAGLMLGLAASVARAELHVTGGIISGLIVGVQPIAATLAAVALGPALGARRLVRLGYCAVLAGVAIECVSFWMGSVPLILLGASVAGLGFGGAFSGTLRLLTPLAPAHQRAQLFAAIYLVGYLSYGLPTVAVGILVEKIGLLDGATVYAAAIGVVMLAALTASRRLPGLS
ncbi:bicyclomycin/multidrug efflux system [Rhodococcus erythropolis]|uniref:MFS transporter n=1 Tax=Rhodococcus erythropolis TaxID=1833 RepID=UPI000BB34896|nr:MFS transporter [Rhodococcus erythropolis]PBI91913.1 bicyclomycin/multidrug efflux system [Rhodococcus erythropolis]